MTEHQSEDIRREQILDSATHLFVERGYEDTTVDEIAKHAGLSKGAIYWYFKSKLEILFALTDRHIHEEQTAVVNMAESEMGPEALYKSHRDLYRNQMSKPDREQVFCQLNGLASRFPEIREKLADYHHKWDSTSAVLIQRAVDNGHFRTTNALFISQAISAMYQGLYSRKQLDPDIDIPGVIEFATKLFYDALTNENEEHGKHNGK